MMLKSPSSLVYSSDFSMSYFIVDPLGIIEIRILSSEYPMVAILKFSSRGSFILNSYPKSSLLLLASYDVPMVSECSALCFNIITRFSMTQDSCETCGRPHWYSADMFPMRVMMLHYLCRRSSAFISMNPMRGNPMIFILAICIRGVLCQSTSPHPHHLLKIVSQTPGRPPVFMPPSGLYLLQIDF